MSATGVGVAFEMSEKVFEHIRGQIASMPKNDPIAQTLAGIVAARDGLRKAKAMKCRCNGITLQYEGSCKCERGKAVKEAEVRFWDLVSNL